VTTIQELRTRKHVLAARTSAIASGPLSPRERAEFQQLDSEQRRLTDQIKVLEGPDSKPTREQKNRAFVRYLRYGLHPTEREIWP
jgi:hypothetical protein